MASALITCDGLISAMRDKLASMSEAELADFKKYLQIPENIYIAEVQWNEEQNKIQMKRTDGVLLEIDLCKFRAPQPCEYFATAQLKACSSVCGKPDRVAWAYHPDDMRDPAATVRVANKDDETLAWIYPTEDKAHNIDIRDETSGEIIGYAMASPIRRVFGEGCGCSGSSATGTGAGTGAGTGTGTGTP